MSLFLAFGGVEILKSTATGLDPAAATLYLQYGGYLLAGAGICGLYLPFAFLSEDKRRRRATPK